jgi:predicted small secreted protein
MTTSQKSILLALLTSALLACSACNTANGFGKDVERAGEKIQSNAK